MMNTITCDFGYTFFSKKKCFLYVSMMRRWHLLDISARKSSIVNDCEFLSSSLVLQNKPSVAPGNIGSNLGQDQNPIVTIVIYSLTHSLNSTTIVALPPIGGSSLKKRKKKALTLKTTTLRLLNVIIFYPIVKLVKRASLCAIMPKQASIDTVDLESWVRELISGTN